MKLVFKRNDEVNVDDYIQVRDTANFMPYSKSYHKESIKNSLHTCVIYKDNDPAAIARLVGDNKLTFFIKDVVVKPEYRGMGLGKKVLNDILNYIEENAAPNAYIALMASKESENFYKKFGFIKRPNDKFGSGMIKFKS